MNMLFRLFPGSQLLCLCLIVLLSANQENAKTQSTICAKGNSICIPEDYSKFDLPNETKTVVNVGIDIKDIPKISDKDFSVTLNAFFVVRWKEGRLMIDQDKIENNLARSDDRNVWILVDVNKNTEIKIYI